MKLSYQNIKRLPKNRLLFLIAFILLFLVIVLSPFLFLKDNGEIEDSSAATTSYKLWEEITLDFTGSHNGMSQSSSNPNPYLDYRLTVTFTTSGKTYTVPGYFVGDGAGNTGNKWRVHFSADRAGTWTYSADLKTGANVAVNGGGTAVQISPATGSFSIAGESTLGGFYTNCGRLEYVGKHYLQCAKTKQYWVKGGTNSPENLLAGADTGNEGNIRTVLDYLSSQKVNSVYFLPNNIGGDGNGDTHPYVSSATSASAFGYEDLVHYKTSKLTKWNDIFKFAMQKDISLEFVLNEQEEANRLLLGPDLTNQRKLFYRELVARYSHHPAVRWIITEENKFSNENLISFAGYIRTLDPYKHPIAVHTNVDSPEFYEGLIGNSNFDSASLQFYTIPGSADNASAFTETWRRKSAERSRPWVIELDEAILKEDSRYGMTKDNMDDLRSRVLYPGLFSGGNISWYYGYDQDRGMSLWKFQDREPMWKWMWYARKLLYEFPNRAEMIPGDELIVSQSHSGGKTQVYYQAGKTYLVYMANTTGGENAKINLSSAIGKNLTLQWYNPRTGEYDGSAQVITPSSSFTIGASPKASSGDRDDWVVVIKSDDVVIPPGTKAYIEQNGLIVIQPETKPYGQGWALESSVSGYTGSGYLKWSGSDFFTVPGNGLTEYKLFVENPGTYNLRIRANKRDPNPSEDNDVWTKINNEQWYKTFNSNQQTNQWSFPTQYEIVHPTNMPAATVNLTAGLNTFYISGRSNGFYIDRIHFYKNGVSNPEDLNHPESQYADVSDGPVISCNSVCTSDSQCSDVNSNWYCATQFNNQPWRNEGATYSLIRYTTPSGEIKTETGPTTSISILHEDGGTVIYLVKNGRVYYKGGDNTDPWEDQTDRFTAVGCNLTGIDCSGKITGVNYHRLKDGRLQFHIIRNTPTSFSLVTVISGVSTLNETQNLINVGDTNSGPITSFNSAYHRDGYKIQNVVRGGRIYERTDLGGWGDWYEVTNSFSTCTSSTTNNCGTGRIISFERGPNVDGNDIFYLIRENNVIFSRVNIPAEERCRLMNNPWSNTCSVSASSTPTPVPSRTPSPTPSRTPTPIPSRTPTPIPSRTPTPIVSRTPSPTPLPNALCLSKTAVFKSGNPLPNSEVEYTITLANPAPAPNGSIVIKDFYSSNLTILSKPTYCPQVGGISSTIEESSRSVTFVVGLVLISSTSVILFITFSDKNRRVKIINLVRKSPYISGLAITGTGILLIVIVYQLQKDFSPSDTPAAGTGKSLICTLPAGVKTVTYTAKINSGTSGTVTNNVEVYTQSAQTSTCSKTFTIVQPSSTPTGTLQPTLTPSPTPRVSTTPSLTPTSTRVPSVSATPSIRPSATLTSTPGPSLTPSRTPVPSATVSVSLTPTPLVYVEGICGPIDITNDLKISILDFGISRIGFASAYGRVCEDTEEDYASYNSCAGKDSDRSGKVDIFDFISFAERYNKPSCSLDGV